MNKYFQHYGLRHDPFPVDQENELFFSTPELEHRLELIRHMVEFSHRFLVVTGHPQSGKTTLLKHLVKTADDKWRISQVSFDEIHTVEDFIEQVYKEQNLEYRERDAVAMQLPILQEHFTRIHENNLFPVLMIDDGHRLSIELLKLLIDLAIPENNKPGLHVVLFSDTDLADLISHKNLSFIHSIDIPPFNEEQLKSYLDFRLKEAGYIEGEPLIGEKMLLQIYKASNGLPGLVNELAAKALNDPALVQQENPYWQSIRSHLLNTRLTIPFALVLTAVFVIILLPTEETDTEMETRRIEVPLPSVIGSSITTDQTELPSEKINKEAELEEVETVVITVPEEPIETKSGGKQETDSDIKEKINKQIETAEVSPQPAIEEGKKVEIAVEIQPSPEIKAASQLSETVKIVEAKPVEIPVVKNGEIKSPEVNIVKEVENKIVQTEPVSTKKSSIRGVSWLKKQSPDHYVLQLMGAHDEAVINKFISQHPEIRKDIARFKTVNHNKIWHVLLMGIYENHDQAVAAILTLPAKIRALKPWPRKIQTIHKDLN